MRDVCDVLDAKGYPRMAGKLRGCGTTVTEDCPHCGEECARVEVRATCGLRICPWCGRVAAMERAVLVGGGVRLAFGTAQELKDKALESIGAEIAETERKVAFHERVASKARQRWMGIEQKQGDGGRAAPASWHKAKETEKRATARADKLRTTWLASLKRQLHAVRECHSWDWKLITITGQYDPMDPASFKPSALRHRVKKVVACWSRCWKAGACAGGLAFASLHVECSSKGHVHAHVLYLGPYVAQEWWQKVAGTIVDVRAVGVSEDGSKPEFGSVYEAVKYATKLPSPTKDGWIAGENWRVMSPELAAAWSIATSHLQLHRYYGIADRCVRKAEEKRKGQPKEPMPETAPCPRCGMPVPRPKRIDDPVRVARLLGREWRVRVKVRRYNDYFVSGSQAPPVSTVPPPMTPEEEADERRWQDFIGPPDDPFDVDGDAAA